VLLGPAAIFAAVTLATRGRAAVRRELRPPAAVAGVGMVGAYMLVLAALELAPAAPVAAVRESSVLVAVLAAGPLLGERVGRARLAGAALVVAGVVLVGVA